MAPPVNLACIRCRQPYPLETRHHQCESCAANGVFTNLTVGYGDRDIPDRSGLPENIQSLWRYEHALPTRSGSPVSMGEGLTPLVSIEDFGRDKIQVKDESRNPTGSFKDRLATVAISWIRAFGKPVIGVSSTGNAGAAAAAYAARAGLTCVVLTSRSTPGALLGQMRSYGALVVTLPTIEDRWTVLARAVRELGWYPTAPFFGPAIGSHPVGIEGYKTIAFEIAESRGWNVPDWCVLPVCYGDALFGMWKGFEEMRAWGWIETCPRLVAAEVSGSLPSAIRRNQEMPVEISPDRTSLANSIAVSRGTYQALHALRRTNGLAVTVDDTEILDARDRLARNWGLSAELSSAAAFAAVAKLSTSGLIRSNEDVTVVMTASGMKDYGLTGLPQSEVPSAEPELESVLRNLENSYGLHI